MRAVLSEVRGVYTPLGGGVCITYCTHTCHTHTHTHTHTKQTGLIFETPEFPSCHFGVTNILSDIQTS